MDTSSCTYVHSMVFQFLKPLLEEMTNMCNAVDPAYVKECTSAKIRDYKSRRGCFMMHMWSASLAVFNSIDAPDASAACRMLSDAITKLECEEVKAASEMPEVVQANVLVKLSREKLTNLLLPAVIGVMGSSSMPIRSNIAMFQWGWCVRSFVNNLKAGHAMSASEDFTELQVFRRDLHMLLTEHGPTWHLYCKHARYAYDRSVRPEKFAVSTDHATMRDLVEMSFLHNHGDHMALFTVSMEGVCTQIPTTDDNAMLTDCHLSDEKLIWIVEEDKLAATFASIHATAEGFGNMWKFPL